MGRLVFISGIKKYECTYNKGNKSGLYQEWNLGGKNIKNITYKIGKRIKEYEFIKDGNRFMEINKKNGFLDGRWVRWYATGLKEEEGDYSKGIRVGTWSRYDLNGQIIEESNYDNKGRNL